MIVWSVAYKPIVHRTGLLVRRIIFSAENMHNSISKAYRNELNPDPDSLLTTEERTNTGNAEMNQKERLIGEAISEIGSIQRTIPLV